MGGVRRRPGRIGTLSKAGTLKKEKKPVIPWEHIEQCCLMFWAKELESAYPVLELLRASFNPGKVSWHMGKKMRREGAKAGFPDLELNVARQGYHALFIEMKAKDGDLTRAQKRVFPRLLAEGNQVHVCYSWHAAAAVIVEYLGLDVVIDPDRWVGKFPAEWVA